MGKNLDHKNKKKPIDRQQLAKTQPKTQTERLKTHAWNTRERSKPTPERPKHKPMLESQTQPETQTQTPKGPASLPFNYLPFSPILK